MVEEFKVTDVVVFISARITAEIATGLLASLGHVKMVCEPHSLDSVFWLPQFF